MDVRRAVDSVGTFPRRHDDVISLQESEVVLKGRNITGDGGRATVRLIIVVSASLLWCEHLKNSIRLPWQLYDRL